MNSFDRNEKVIIQKTNFDVNDKWKLIDFKRKLLIIISENPFEIYRS